MGPSRLAPLLIAALVLWGLPFESLASDTIEYASDAGDDDGPEEIFTDPEDDDSAAPLYGGQFSGSGVSCDNADRGAAVGAAGWLLLVAGWVARRRSVSVRYQRG